MFCLLPLLSKEGLGVVLKTNMAKIFNSKFYKSRRQRLRNEMPQAEIELWKYLRRKQLLGHKFRRQQGIGAYVVDFYCPRLKLAIEVDGNSHFDTNTKTYDKHREQKLAELDITTLRFTNQEILTDLASVLEQIKSRITRFQNPL